MYPRKIESLSHEFLPLKVTVKSHASRGFYVEAFVDSSFAEESEHTLDSEDCARQQARAMHARWSRILESVYQAGVEAGITSISTPDIVI